LIKLNALQYNKLKDSYKIDDYSLSALVDNESFENLCINYKEKFGLKKLKTFSFSKEGFLGLFLELKANIAISLGESKAVIEAGKLYEDLGFNVTWINLNKDGKVNLSQLKDLKIDFLFLSSYIMDTFVKTDLEDVKKLTNAKIISNASANFDKLSDMVYFDSYKLIGINSSSVILFNDDEFELLSVGQVDSLAARLIYDALSSQEFNYEMKPIFLKKLKKTFFDDIYFFVKPDDTLAYSLHFGLKGIKARELIRTLALSKIYLTNGEGCSLGLSNPSSIIQSMGYDESTSRNSISLTFTENISEEEIDKLINTMYLKYKQIKILN
jgi:cysteine desulfurase